MVQTAYLDTLLDPWSVCNVPGSRLLLKARRIHGLTKFGYSRTTTPVHEFTPPLLHGVSFNTAARASANRYSVAPSAENGKCNTVTTIVRKRVRLGISLRNRRNWIRSKMKKSRGEGRGRETARRKLVGGPRGFRKPTGDTGWVEKFTFGRDVRFVFG